MYVYDWNGRELKYQVPLSAEELQMWGNPKLKSSPAPPQPTMPGSTTPSAKARSSDLSPPGSQYTPTQGGSLTGAPSATSSAPGPTGSVHAGGIMPDGTSGHTALNPSPTTGLLGKTNSQSAPSSLTGAGAYQNLSTPTQMPGYPQMPATPTLPPTPKASPVPNAPALPQTPKAPSAPALPQMPNAPSMPNPSLYGGANQEAMKQNSMYLGRSVTDAPTPGMNLVDRHQFAPDERGFDHARYAMTPDQTVEGRLEGILAKDSPLMQRAATTGMQFANSRGLLNSTMAAGATQGAMIDRATPIAQQDAAQAWQRHNQSLSDQQAREMEYIRNDIQMSQAALQQAINQGDMQLANKLELHLREQTEYLNRGTAELNSMLAMGRDTHNANLDVAKMGYQGAMDMTKLGYQTEADMLKMGYGADVDMSKLGYQTQADMARMGYGAQVDMDKMGYQAQVDMARTAFTAEMDLAKSTWMHQLDEGTRTRLMDLEAGYSRMLNYDAHASEAFKASMQAIGLLNTNPDMSPEQQKAGTQQITGMMQSHLSFLDRLYGGTGGPPAGGQQGVAIGEAAGGTRAPSASMSKAAAYIERYPDVRDFWERNNPKPEKKGSDRKKASQMSLEEFAEWHFNNTGKKENREW